MQKNRRLQCLWVCKEQMNPLAFYISRFYLVRLIAECEVRIQYFGLSLCSCGQSRHSFFRDYFLHFKFFLYLRHLN